MRNSDLPLGSKRNLLFIILAICGYILFRNWSLLPESDNPKYFQFIDTREMLGIPNAMDVLSNIPFLMVGVIATFWITQARKQFPNIYLFFGGLLSLAIILTCFGSSYFHLSPVRERLFWDRLPMTLCFSGIVCLLVTDRISSKAGTLAALLLIPLSMLSVVGWYYEWLSLRPYIIVQFGSMLFILLIMLTFRNGRIPNKLLFQVLGFYLVAKVLESYDSQIFQFTAQTISGHTLKHFVAAIAMGKMLSAFSLRP